MANILKAIKNIVEYPHLALQLFYHGKNRVNMVGEALENYIKDTFAGSFNISEIERKEKYKETFSYLGNQNNPPDLILKDGDAIETKKIQGKNSALALNSSYPKAKLFIDSPMITEACRNCESWTEKDIIYAVGNTDNEVIKSLWLVYGDCFVADKTVYERIKNTISNGINNIPNVEFTATNELGKVKKVDPLGITDLRIRGMWHIEHPNKIFSYLNCIDDACKFQLLVLIKTEKFNSFSEEDKNNILQLKSENCQITDVEIKNPDNPAQWIKTKLINFKTL